MIYLGHYLKYPIAIFFHQLHCHHFLLLLTFYLHHLKIFHQERISCHFQYLFVVFLAKNKNSVHLNLYGKYLKTVLIFRLEYDTLCFNLDLASSSTKFHSIVLSPSSSSPLPKRISFSLLMSSATTSSVSSNLIFFALG